MLTPYYLFYQKNILSFSVWDLVVVVVVVVVVTAEIFSKHPFCVAAFLILFTNTVAREGVLMFFRCKIGWNLVLALCQLALLTSPRLCHSFALHRGKESPCEPETLSQP